MPEKLITTGQTLATMERVLIEDYLPGFSNQLNTEAAPLLSKIKKTKATAHEFSVPTKIGFSGGFGFGAEGEKTPKSGAVRTEKLQMSTKDMYTEVVISQKAVKLGSGNRGSMIDALDTEVNGAYETARWNVSRALHGNGSGVLAGLSALESAGNTLTVDSTKCLREGLRIDIYADGASEPVTGDGGVRITDVDYENNQIVVDGPAATYAKGFITIQNSFNREITGLGAIFDTNIAKLYGIDKEKNNFIRPFAFDAGGDVDDSVITRALRQAKNVKGSKVDTWLCGDATYDHYVDYLRTNNIRVEDNSHVIQGGFKAIKFLFDNREIDIINESFVPDTEAWGIESPEMEFRHTDWEFAQLQGGGIFNLMERQSAYRALLTNYGELVCKHPGGCIRLYNCV